MRILLAAAVLALAACGSPASHATAAVPRHSGVPVSASAKARPSAMTLAREVPGTTGCQQITPDAEAIADVSCSLPDGSQLILATFATGSAEAQWIGNGGPGPAPGDPYYAGCCIQGNGWAATVGAPDYSVRGGAIVTAVLGGRVVNG